MSLHNRYLQQAAWTRETRAYLFGRTGFDLAHRVLEVGCGTGAILVESSVGQPTSTSRHQLLHGLDLDADALAECAANAPSAILTQADSLTLPFPDRVFDIAFCHYLLLWVKDPVLALREMKRVTRRHVLALAEPDYAGRVDFPEELVPLGRLQAQALAAQGADVAIGSRLAILFEHAGIDIVECGPITPWSQGAPTVADLQGEWTVLEADLAGSLPQAELERFRILDARARERGERVLYVPTYFAWGQV